MIQLGKKYQTKSGLKVRIIAVNGPGEFPVVGEVEGDTYVNCWTLKGKYSIGSESDLDLIELKRSFKDVVRLTFYLIDIDGIKYIQSDIKGSEKIIGKKSFDISVEIKEGEGLTFFGNKD